MTTTNGQPERIVVLSGGVGGARFTRGLLAHLQATAAASATDPAQVTAIVNTGDDMWLHGVRVCPDLDTMMYTLGAGIDESQGWGRAGESTIVSDDLRHYDLGWDWFTLGDLDLATHLARTELLRRGLPLSAVTARLCERWQPGARLLPMTDDEVETMVVMAGQGPPQARTVHFEEWWVRHRASVAAERFSATNLAQSVAAPGVVEAIEHADVIVLPPSNPVVSVGTILAIPGITEALTGARAPIVGVSPIIGGSAVRGMADACLSTIGVQTSAGAVARHYRERHGILDAWLVDTSDTGEVAGIEAAGILARATPLWMTDVAASAAMAAEALALAAQVTAKYAS